MTPRNAYNLRAALQLMRRDASLDNSVAFENHGGRDDALAIIEPLRLGAPACVRASLFFGSLNEYRHQRLCGKRRELLP